jgi:colanic acid biosynthesis glycosyl transferase WcaI
MHDKLVIVTELYYPEQNATGHYLTGIATGLAADPLADVTVLTAQPRYNQRGVKALKYEIRDNVQIYRCWSTTYSPHRLAGRLSNMLTTTFSLGLKALTLVEPGDKVLVVTNPPLLPLIVYLACYLKRAKLVLLAHDIYPDVFIPLELSRPSNLIFRAFSRINTLLYTSADRVITLGRDMKNLIDQKTAGKANTVIITNWADLDTVSPVPPEASTLLKEIGLTGKFIIQYCGNHGRTHDLKTIIRAARILRHDATIHFLFIGNGSAKAAVVDLATKWKLPNVTFRETVERSQLSDALSSAHIAVIALKKGMSGISVPSRLYNQMASARPIIGVVEASSEVAQVIYEELAGRVVSPGCPKALATAILELRADKAACQEFARNARKAAESRYSYATASTQYRNLFRSL